MKDMGNNISRIRNRDVIFYKCTESPTTEYDDSRNFYTDEQFIVLSSNNYKSIVTISETEQ